MPGCTAVTETGNVVQLEYLECIFGRFVSYLLGFAGIAFFLMFILGGYKYITSAGDPKAVDSAQKTLTYAVGGLILVSVAFLILRFIQVFTGANVTNFVIKVP